jgi:hypothetical protein
MNKDQINVNLFDQVQKLQDYKRRAEAEMITMAQANDRLRDAANALEKYEYVAAASYAVKGIPECDLAEAWNWASTYLVELSSRLREVGPTSTPPASSKASP